MLFTIAALIWREWYCANQRQLIMEEAKFCLKQAISSLVPTERATSKMENFNYDMEMEDMFKDLYVLYIVRLLPKVEPSLEFQLLYLHHIWRDVGDLIPRREFFDEFALGCDVYGFPADFYNIHDAFDFANRDWKPELMERVSDTLKRINQDHM